MGNRTEGRKEAQLGLTKVQKVLKYLNGIGITVCVIAVVWTRICRVIPYIWR